MSTSLFADRLTPGMVGAVVQFDYTHKHGTQSRVTGILRRIIASEVDVALFLAAEYPTQFQDRFVLPLDRVITVEGDH